MEGNQLEKHDMNPTSNMDKLASESNAIIDIDNFDNENSTSFLNRSTHFDFTEATFTFKLYAVVTIVVTGTICNTLSLMTFMMPKLRSTPVGHYLIALAVADTIVLVGEAMILLSNERLGLRLIHHYTSLCRITYFLRYSGRLWSAMLTVAISAERYLFIAHPLKGVWLRTTAVAKGIMISSMVVSHGLSSYAIYTLRTGKLHGTGGVRCRIDPEQMKVFTLCDLIISRALADVVIGLVVVVFTAMILRSLIIARRRRVQMLPDIVQTCRHHASSVRELQMTLTLILIAVFFLVLKLPYTVCWYVRHYSKDADNPKPLMTNAVNITYVFSVATYAINFFLYSLCGSTFRNNLRMYLRIPYVSRPSRSSDLTLIPI